MCAVEFLSFFLGVDGPTDTCIGHQVIRVLPGEALKVHVSKFAQKIGRRGS